MSIKVTVRLVGIFKIGRFREEVREYSSARSVQDVVDELGIPVPLLGIVLVNDIHSGVDHVLKDGDSLCLLPFIDGG